jgi:hypothetical protein
MGLINAFLYSSKQPISVAVNVTLYINNTVFKLENREGKKEIPSGLFTA